MIRNEIQGKASDKTTTLPNITKLQASLDKAISIPTKL